MSPIMAQLIAGFAGVAATVVAKYVEVWLTRRYRLADRKALEEEK